MGFASLYQKYRPQTFAELVGQPHVAKTLANAVDKGHLFHAYLFSGPRGTGKTSTARILAKAINCVNGPTSRPCGECQPCTEIAAGTFPDVIEIDAATHSKVEETRDFLANVPTGLSMIARKRFYIIDEVHMLSTHAFNALLKTLEEPPEHVTFVLATTEPHKVPATIAGRCQHFEFRLVPSSELVEHYRRICELEGVEYTQGALARVAALARGSVRDGLSILDQLIAATGGKLTEDEVDSLIGPDTLDYSMRLAEAIATGDLEAAIAASIEVGESGHEYRAFAQSFTSFLRELLLVAYLTPRQASAVAGLDPDRAGSLTELSKMYGVGRILRCIQIMGEVLGAMASGSPAQVAFELGLIRMCRPEDDHQPAEIEKRVDSLARKLAVLEKKLAKLDAPAESPVREKSAPNVGMAVIGESASRPASSGTHSGDSSIKAEPATENEVAVGEADEGKVPDSIYELWKRFLEELRAENRMREQAIYVDARPESLESDSLVISFPESKMFHVRQAERLAERVSDALGRVFGRPVTLKVCARPEASVSTKNSQDDRGGSPARSVQSRPHEEGGPEESTKGGRPRSDGVLGPSTSVPPAERTDVATSRNASSTTQDRSKSSTEAVHKPDRDEPDPGEVLGRILMEELRAVPIEGGSSREIPDDRPGNRATEDGR